jgi:hypothetical protein
MAKRFSRIFIAMEEEIKKIAAKQHRQNMFIMAASMLVVLIAEAIILFIIK